MFTVPLLIVAVFDVTVAPFKMLSVVFPLLPRWSEPVKDNEEFGSETVMFAVLSTVFEVSM